MNTVFWLMIAPLIILAECFIRACMEINHIAEAIGSVWQGKPIDDPSIAMDGDLSVNELCVPITPEMLRRMHACTQVGQQRMHMELRHPFKLLRGIYELDVTYDFKGTEPDGQTLTISEAARVRVYYEQHGRARMLVIRRVELVDRKE